MTARTITPAAMPSQRATGFFAEAAEVERWPGAAEGPRYFPTARRGGGAHGLEGRLHFRARLETLGGLLREGAGDDGVEPRIGAGALAGQLEGALRHFAAEHFVEHHAEAVDVGAMIDVRPRFCSGAM